MKQHAFKWARRFWACMFCSVFAVSLLAVPARREWRTVPQADGTTIEVMVIGDEFYHYTINRDGKQVREVDGMYQVVGEAPTAEIAKARRAKAMARRQRKAVGITPNLAPKGVVILVNFSDKSMQSSHTQAVFDELCNSTNCTVNSGYPSAAQFFADQSNGAYRPQFDVFGPVTLSHNVAYYGTDLEGQEEGSDTLATNAVVEGCILANQQFSINWADYDSDNDGYVDFVYVIYAGKGQADGGTSETIWPHNWSVASARRYGNCTYSNAQCTLGGKKIDNYAMSGEMSGSKLGGIGTLCHEFGHVMGLPDLYDTSYGTNYENCLTPNDWNIMDGGSYNGDGHCPPNYDPWQKDFFGWHKPINLGSAGKNVTLYANGTENYQAYQINASGMYVAPTTSGVRYYIENRQAVGWDAPLTGHGMLIWKVNFEESAWTNNTPNHSKTSGSPLWTIVSATGSAIGWDGETDNCPKNTFPGSGKKTSYTGISGKPLTEITESSGIITCKYMGGKTQCSYELVSEHCTVPTDGTVAINSALSLTITPDAGYILNDAECWMVEMGSGNELVYGQGFTYNATTNEFRIEKVTDDVVILVEGKVKADPVPCTIRFFNNGQQIGDDQVVLQGQQPKVPANPEACNDYSFAGWYTATLAVDNTKKPAYVEDFTVTEAKDYYAVFTLTEIGEGEVAFDGTTGGTFKIYAQIGDVKYYAKAYDKKIESTTDIAEAADYVFEKVDDGFAIKYGDKYIKYGTSGTDFSTSNDAYTWTLGTAVKGSWRLVASSANTRSFVYRAGTVNKFAPYAFSNIKADGNEYFDLEIGGGSSSITYYSTIVNCVPTNVQNIQNDNIQCTKVIRDGQLYILYNGCMYDVRGARIK